MQMNEQKSIRCGVGSLQSTSEHDYGVLEIFFIVSMGDLSLGYLLGVC